VNERITNATKDLAGIGQVSTTVHDISAETGNLQSVSDTVDTFSTLLTPLKAFNSVANQIANVQPSLFLLYATNIHIQVHPYAKAALSILTCASKVGFFLSHRRRRVDDILVTDDS
jgi:hypothetical protein